MEFQKQKIFNFFLLGDFFQSVEKGAKSRRTGASLLASVEHGTLTEETYRKIITHPAPFVKRFFDFWQIAQNFPKFSSELTIDAKNFGEVHKNCVKFWSFCLLTLKFLQRV